MGLVVVWSNLWTIELPFAVALTAAALLALPLWRAAERRRAPPPGATAPGGEDAAGPDDAAEVRGIALRIFVATAALAAFALLAPDALRGFVLPAGATSGAPSDALIDLLVGTSAGASVLIGAYFVQTARPNREAWRRGATVAALGALTLGAALPGPLARAVGLLVPVSLAALVLGVGVEQGARRRRPTLGLRSLALATLPLFLLALLAAIRLEEILALGTG